MPVLKEFLCKAHGVFETSDASPTCPRGCNSIERIFLQPPSVRTSGRTKNIDHTLESLAADFGLTDLSTRNGSVMSSIGAHSKPAHVAASYSNLYGDPRADSLRPRFASPGEIGNMMEPPGKTPFRGLNGVGDQLHERMGARNIDPSLTVIEHKTSADDNAKLQAALQGGGTP